MRLKQLHLARADPRARLEHEADGTAVLQPQGRPGCSRPDLLDSQAARGQGLQQFGFGPRQIEPRRPVGSFQDDHLPVVNRSDVGTWPRRQQRKAAPPSGIGRKRPPKQNQSSPYS
jgi:hypothetical protein